MIITVIKGGHPLTTEERNKIRSIFKESKCPKESLENSFPGFSGFNGKILHIDNYDGDKYGYPEDMEV